MGIREETKKIRLQEWSKIIRDRIDSGLTIDRYCREHNITRDAYFYWLRQLRRAELEKQEHKFTELIVPQSAQITVIPEVASPVTINIGKCSITVQDKETLRTVVEVLLDAQ